MRGKHITKPIEEVIREANELAADGVRELIIVAQDTTYYGMDFYGRTRLTDLLRELDGVDGVGVDSHTLCLSGTHFRRTARHARECQQDHSLSGYAAPTHQRPRIAANDPTSRSHTSHRKTLAYPSHQVERPCHPHDVYCWIPRGKPMPNSRSCGNSLRTSSLKD